MKKEECFHYGKIIKTHGFKGELIASVDADLPGIFENTAFVFLDLDGLLVPFYIESSNLSGGKTLYLKLEDIDTNEASKRICDSDIWLPKNLLSEKHKQQFELTDFSGYHVVDKIKGNIGILNSIIEMPQQQMLEISSGSKEILIPVAEEILKSIDKKNKTIHIDAPEGLIDLYLNT